MGKQWKLFLRTHWKSGLSCVCGTVILSGFVILGGAYWLTDGQPVSFFHFLQDYRLVKNNYFRPINEEALWQGASKGMLSSLEDPYSSILAGDTYNPSWKRQTGNMAALA